MGLLRNLVKVLYRRLEKVCGSAVESGLIAVSEKSHYVAFLRKYPTADGQNPA